MTPPTEEVIKAAQLLERWTKENGWQDWELCGVADRGLVCKLQDKIKELEQWKNTQMLVAADTHYHEIAKEIGLTIGDYIAPAILPWIKQAKEALIDADLYATHTPLLQKFTQRCNCELCQEQELP